MPGYLTIWTGFASKSFLRISLTAPASDLGLKQAFFREVQQNYFVPSIVFTGVLPFPSETVFFAIDFIEAAPMTTAVIRSTDAPIIVS